MYKIWAFNEIELDDLQKTYVLLEEISAEDMLNACEIAKEKYPNTAIRVTCESHSVEMSTFTGNGDFAKIIRKVGLN